MVDLSSNTGKIANCCTGFYLETEMLNHAVSFDLVPFNCFTAQSHPNPTRAIMKKIADAKQSEEEFYRLYNDVVVGLRRLFDGDEDVPLLILGKVAEKHSGISLTGFKQLAVGHPQMLMDPRRLSLPWNDAIRQRLLKSHDDNAATWLTCINGKEEDWLPIWQNRCRGILSPKIKEARRLNCQRGGWAGWDLAYAVIDADGHQVLASRDTPGAMLMYGCATLKGKKGWDRAYVIYDDDDVPHLARRSDKGAVLILVGGASLKGKKGGMKGWDNSLGIFNLAWLKANHLELDWPALEAEFRQDRYIDQLTVESEFAAFVRCKMMHQENKVRYLQAHEREKISVYFREEDETKEYNPSGLCALLGETYSVLRERALAGRVNSMYGWYRGEYRLCAKNFQDGRSENEHWKGGYGKKKWELDDVQIRVQVIGQDSPGTVMCMYKVNAFCRNHKSDVKANCDATKLPRRAAQKWKNGRRVGSKLYKYFWITLPLP
jgi:hypothetical protein